jgi:hypothetical protein
VGDSRGAGARQKAVEELAVMHRPHQPGGPRRRRRCGIPPNSFCVVPGVLANVAEGIPGVCLVIGFRNPMVQIERLLTVGQCLLNSPRRA